MVLCGVCVSALQDQDHYALLGLQDKRWLASQDDIKRACECSCFFSCFIQASSPCNPHTHIHTCMHAAAAAADRKMVLKHHPDKKGDLSAAEMKKADEYFGRIQKGQLTNASTSS